MPDDDEAAPGGLGRGFSSEQTRQFSLFGKNVASFGSKFEFKIPGLSDTTKDLHGLNDELDSLSKRIAKLNTQAPGVKSFFGAVSEGAKSALSDVRNLNQEMGAASMTGGAATMGGGNSAAFGGAGGGSAMFGVGGGGGGAFAGSASNDVVSTLISSTAGAPGGGGPGALIQAALGLLLKPVQLAYNRVEENRAATMRGAGYLGNVATRGGGFGTGGNGIQDLMGLLSERLPMQGGYDDMLQALSLGSRMGFGISGTNPNLNGGFWTAARQMQQMNPGTEAPQIVQSLGGFMGNAQAVQKSVMYSGGAFSFQRSGGGQKSMQDWAQGLLRFFQDQRPGKMRGKAFSQGELQAQQFPGSNIDAWFSLNQVPPDLRDAFWQYAIGSSTPGVGASWDEVIRGTRGEDILMARLRGESQVTRRDLTFATQPGMGGGGQTMYQAFNTREAADQWFNQMLSKTLDTALPAMLNTLGMSGAIGAIPTPIANMLYQTLMSTPNIAGKIGATEAFGFGGGAISGDPGWRRRGVGDADYGPLGSSSLFGMTPTMQDRLGAMIAANPNISITSGYRDGGTQSRLFANGVGATAPAGQSSHAHGVAADIGPESQYGWIAANASQFGLQVAGDEPWHVGLPGTMPIMGDPRRRRGGIGDGGISWQGFKDFLRIGGVDASDPGPAGKAIGKTIAGAADFADPAGLASLALSIITGDMAGAGKKAMAWLLEKIPGMGGILGGDLSTAGGIAKISGGIAGFLTNSKIQGSAGGLGGMLNAGATVQNAANSLGALGAAAAGVGGDGANRVSRDETSFGTALLQQMGLPVTPSNIRAINAWAQAEGGHAAYNPLNTTQNMPGATKYNSVGVKNYTSLDQGVQATAKTLGNGRYGPILAAFQQGSSAKAVGAAVESSPWGTGGGVLKVLGDPQRRAALASAMGYGYGGGGGGGGISFSPVVIHINMPIQTTRASEPDPRRLAQNMASTVQQTLDSVVALNA